MEQNLVNDLLVKWEQQAKKLVEDHGGAANSPATVSGASLYTLNSCIQDLKAILEDRPVIKDKPKKKHWWNKR